jgi:quercetin dioxygenase-like cupin family protein
MPALSTAIEARTGVRERSPLAGDGNVSEHARGFRSDTTATEGGNEQMSNVTTNAMPSLVGPGEGDAYWFLGALATIKASTETTGGGVAVIEHLAPQGHGSPLHVHTREDEWFYVLEGELTFWVDGQVSVAPAGSFVFGPKGLPHTFIVSSEVARFLLVTEPAGFEQFTRALGQPAARREIPPPATEPPDVDGLTKLATTFGLQIIGPPGIPA